MPKGRPQDYKIPGKPSSGVKPSAMKGLGKPATPGKEFGMSMKGVGRQGKGKGLTKRKG